MEDFLHFAPLITALVSLCNFAGLIIVAVHARAAATKKQTADIEKRVMKLEIPDVPGIEKRVIKLEALNLPGWNELNEMKGQWHAINGDLKALSAKIEGLSSSLGSKVEGLSNLLSAHSRTLDLVEQHLLTGKE